MAINYARMAATAVRLLQQNGIPMQLRRTPPQTMDPTTGVATAPKPVFLPTHGIFKQRDRFYQVTGRGVGGVRQVDNVLMQERTVVIDGSQKPQLNDYLVVQGEVFQILDIEEKTPAGTPLVYILTVRR